VAAQAESGFFAIRWYRTTRRFCRDAMHELREVVWPSREELKSHTALVLTVIIGVTVLMAVCDIVFMLVFDKLLNLYGTHGQPGI
jgi:preprotein translocase SecE subunit